MFLYWFGSLSLYGLWNIEFLASASPSLSMFPTCRYGGYILGPGSAAAFSNFLPGALRNLSIWHYMAGTTCLRYIV